MSMPGLMPPGQSAWDPLIEGEESIDPMGLAPNGLRCDLKHLLCQGDQGPASR